MLYYKRLGAALSIFPCVQVALENPALCLASCQKGAGRLFSCPSRTKASQRFQECHQLILLSCTERGVDVRHKGFLRII